MKKFSFRKNDRLVKKHEFERVFNQGKKKEGKNFIVYIEYNELQRVRLGIRITKRLGKATQRNVIKRRIREWFRLNRDNLSLSGDIVIKPRTGAVHLSYGELRKELNAILL